MEQRLSSEVQAETLSQQLIESIELIEFLITAAEAVPAETQSMHLRMLVELVGALLIGGPEVVEQPLREELGKRLQKAAKHKAFAEGEEAVRLPEMISVLRLALIRLALKQHDGNCSKAARQLGISPQAVYQHLDKMRSQR